MVPIKRPHEYGETAVGPRSADSFSIGGFAVLESRGGG